MSALFHFVLSSAVAAGGACPSSPVNFDAASCSVGGTPVCAVNGSGHLVCDLTTATSASDAVVVTDFQAGTDFEMWGKLGSTNFCCQIAATGVYEVHLLGSSHGDTLRFAHAALSFNLYNPGIEQSLVGRIYGNELNDVVIGSNSSAYDYTEFLHGGTGLDTCSGNGGDDYIEGNEDDDVLNGDGGADEMYGNDGADTMRGGDADDVMSGGNDRDRMDGGEGDDIMDGGSAGDVMCGGGELTAGDHLYDGDSTDESPGPVDELWSSTAADTVECDNSSTVTDGAATAIGMATCTATLTTKPSLCP